MTAVWIFVALIVLVKLPVAALMLWIPYRSDSAMHVERSAPDQGDEGEQDEDDGGDEPPPGGTRPRAPRPRRGPHADRPPASPPRSRRQARAPGAAVGRRVQAG
ncbi:MAG: hypothetical protein KGJ43_05390 [Acidobacteriota bacterium]|nr:hypothetical protein [Acidobacteriota bacterium]